MDIAQEVWRIHPEDEIHPVLCGDATPRSADAVAAAKDLPNLPPRPIGLLSVAARGLVCRTIQFVTAAQPRLPRRPAATAIAAILVAWLINSMNWGPGEAKFIVAVCLGSLVATAALVAGWTWEPDEIERWGLRALGAAFVSTLPVLITT